MDLSIRMRVMHKVKHRYAIHLKFGGKFLTSLTNLVLEAKASICTTTKENLLLHCRKFSAFSCRCPNLTHFYNKACITKKHHL